MAKFLCALLVIAGCGPSAPTGVAADAATVDVAPDAPIPFDVASATAIDNTTIAVMFDAPPDPEQATTLANYSVPNLTLSGMPVLVGKQVTLTTAPQQAISYTLAVSGVGRALDQQPLTVATASFIGRAAFDVASATSPDVISVAVTFDAAPDPVAAVILANYSVAGLALHGTPSLTGNTVTIATAGQTATTYTITVANLTRSSDAEPLTIASAQFAGNPVLAPTVTNVVVAATDPDNGTTPFNTGTTTLTITGTSFLTVGCPGGVALDDRDGAGAAVGTVAASCNVDSDTQITAVMPSGTRTNGAAGWNVLVTNAAASNATSAVPFAPRAGLTISEVFTGSGGGADHEFLEAYNPTATALDPSTIHLHVRASTGTDANKPLTAVTATMIPSHGFYLMISTASIASDPWFAHADATYSAALVGNGGAYLSLSATADAQVLDKAGWGTQPAPGFETAPLANIGSDQSAERKPASGLGATTDTDDNALDFAAPSTAITPRGTADGPQPGPTFNVVAAMATSHTAVAVTFDAPPDATEATTPANYTIAGLAITAATLAGNTVTLTTAGQPAGTLTVTAANITRALDQLPLTVVSANFAGRLAFDVASAASTSAVTATVTFDGTPVAAQATTLANYAIPGLTLHGTPVLAGNTVTLATSGQTATSFTVTVTGVLRASDGEPLTIASASFTGTAVQPPTVTSVVVASTSPDNGTIPFDTGTTTVTLTGTSFDTVSCPTGVALADLDGAGNPASTQVTSCTVESSTQLTAVLPSGIRTNGATGWSVIVTNAAGANATSPPFVPRAGLLISEVYTGTTGATDHEFLEVYNPTATTFDPTQLHLHIRASTGADTNKPLTPVTAALIPAHGFLLLASTTSLVADPWFTHMDMTFTAALVPNGGAYLSLSTTANAKVIDKVGWGAQAAPGFEGAAATNVANDNSIQRLPAGGAGDATDTDNNSSDFTAPSTAITPLGTGDPIQP